MPKEYDVKRNYYADLELPSTASVEEIKKQYRKLALQYHPDRNAGKETEYIPKFQAIQAAHEILGDSAKKILYDADRRKQGTLGGTTTAAPAQRGNPYQATSNFPPPPRRTQPGEWKRPPTAPPRPQSNGANRFSGFAGTAPPQPPPRADPAQDRTNMFRAWQHMNTAQEKQKGRNSTAGPAPPTPNGQTPRRPQPPPRNDTKFPTDEPIRQGTARPTPYEADGADGRRSAWQAYNHPQQPSQPGVQRSNTTRTPRKQGFDPFSPGSDERPASGSYYSHRHKSEDFGKPLSAAKPEAYLSPKNGRRPNIDPTKPIRPTSDSDNDVPYSEANRERTPYSSFIGEKTDFSANLPRSKSTRDATTMHGQPNVFRPRSTSPLSNAASTGRGTKGATFDFPSTDSEAGTPGSDGSSSAGDSAFSRQPNFHRPPSERPKKIPSPPSRRFGTAAEHVRITVNEPSPNPDNIFKFNDGAAPFTPPPAPTGKSRSEESINLKFSQQWNGTFEGSTDAPSPPLSRKTTYSRQNSGKSRSTFGQPSPLGVNAFGAEFVPPPPPGPAPNASGNSTPADDRSAKEHAFRHPTWNPPPPPPLKTKADGKTPSATTSPNETSPKQHRQHDNNARDPAFSPSDADAMDIDDMPPHQSTVPPTSTDPSTMPPPPKPIRMVSVPPSQWRRQQAAQNGRAASSSQAQSGKVSNLATNLDDLSHVEPFARPVDAGLKNLSGLAEDLPFKSQASNILPFQTDSPQTLDLPSVPIPPSAPHNLTKQSWQVYATAFSIYLKHFHTFNTQVLRHLAAREDLAERKMSQGMAWLAATGDVAGDSGPNGPTGFAAYAREVKEDIRVREAWSVGCDRHVQAVQAFDNAREMVRRLASGGGLADR